MELREQVPSGLPGGMAGVSAAGVPDGIAGAAMATVTEGMVTRLAVLAERSATALDTLTSPEVLVLLDQLRRSAPALTHTLQRLDGLQRSGALDTLLDLAEVVNAAQASIGDSMVARLGNAARTGGELVDLLMTSGLPQKAPALVRAVSEARDAAEADTGAVGPLALWKAMKEPEVQFALKFVLGLARRLPAAVAEEKEA